MYRNFSYIELLLRTQTIVNTIFLCHNVTHL
nr:MAG TPA: hypothetical protein [Caudoviricetes sp.]